MAHVERTCNVWGGYYKRIIIAFVAMVWFKISFCDPVFIPLFFYTLWLVALF